LPLGVLGRRHRSVNFEIQVEFVAFLLRLVELEGSTGGNTAGRKEEGERGEEKVADHSGGASVTADGLVAPLGQETKGLQKVQKRGVE
jgi:hypothetical protein